MKLTFNITYRDGSSREVTANPRSIVAYERQNGSLRGRMTKSAEAWIAWHAAGSPEGALEKWLAQIDDFDGSSQLINITYMDGTKAQATIRVADVVAYEKAQKHGVIDSPMTGVFWMTWHAAGTPGTFDEWLESVDDVEPEDTEPNSPDDELNGGRFEQPPFETEPSGV